MEMTTPSNPTTRRRTLGLAASALVLGTGVAGCLGDDDDDANGNGSDPGDGSNDTDDSDDQDDGSDSNGGENDLGPWANPVESTATPWAELGDLEGELTIYSERTRGQIDDLFDQLESTYPDLTLHVDYGDNPLVQLEQEGENTPADVFYTQSSGSLAATKEMGLTRSLPEDILDAVDNNYRDGDGQWTGVSGRVRAVQFNTNYWSADELPDDIFEYAEDDRFEGVISTRPNSGTFRSFIIAMIVLEGEERTRDWVRSMVEEQDAVLYQSGSQQAQAVHEGEQQIALGNQYYAGRILSQHPDSPLDVTFTHDDPGCLFNVSGLAIMEPTDSPSLAAEFARHVVAAEGQEFFVDVNGEYPVVDGVEYVGDLPTLDEINPPEFDLNALADQERAIDLLRDEDMTV